MHILQTGRLLITFAIQNIWLHSPALISALFLVQVANRMLIHQLMPLQLAGCV